MRKYSWLQFFADGAAASGDGGGEGAAGVIGQDAAGQQNLVVNAADDAQQQSETMAERLKKLGVPEEKLKRRAYQQEAKQPTAEGQDAAAGQENNNSQTTNDTGEEAPKLSFQEMLKANPDYDREFQNIIRSRVRASDGAKTALRSLDPMLNKLAQQYHVQPGEDGGMDYAALSEAVLSDDRFYEDRAAELGVSTEIARKLDQAEALEQQLAAQARSQEQQRQIAEHLDILRSQEAAMREKFPGFDLRAELQNPAFVRMTQPGSGLSVEDAYYAIHRAEIEKARAEQIRQQTAKAVAANRNRPNEGGAKGGSVGQGVSVDWRNATKEQREALKRRIRSGEHIVPGQY